MKIAVIGGGINGIMTAWAGASAGHSIELFERARLMRATSSASSKILHGGLRYLEYGHFRLVAESLRERAWWVEQAPQFARPVEFRIPIYSNSRRSQWKVRLGLALYDFLASSHRLGDHTWHTAQEMLAAEPTLRSEGLAGGWGFYDALMDDYALGCWAACQVQELGVIVHEGVYVERLDEDAGVYVAGERLSFDHVANVAGPWAEALLKSSHLPHKNHLDLVRGSHIVIDEPRAQAYLLQVPDEDRIFFVLPFQGKTLIGTTEARQTLDEPVVCSDQEKKYLLDLRNWYFQPARTGNDLVESFSGLRPLVSSHPDPSKASREYVIEKHKRVTTVFGGKWTSARALGKKVIAKIE